MRTSIRTAKYASSFITLKANIAGFQNPVEFPSPCILIPDDSGGTLAGAIPATGGLDLSYQAEGDISGSAIPASFNGKMDFWHEGKWIINLRRWGTVSAGDEITIPFRVFPYMPGLLSAFYAVEPNSHQSVCSNVNVATTSTTLVSLSQRLQGVVAIGVIPTANPMRFRFGASPAGNLYEAQVAVNVQKIFKGEELPIGELNAITTGLGPDACRVTRYQR